MRRTAIAKSVIAIVVLVTSASWPAASQTVTAPPQPLTEDQIAKLNACIPKTVEEFAAQGRSTCTTRSRYYAADGGSSIRVKQFYTQPHPDNNYRYIAGTASATQDGGQCVHNLYAYFLSETSFQCEWETKGCGLFKEGGHVRGYCSIDVQYRPTPADVVAVKEYCFQGLFGNAESIRPKANPVSCKVD